MKLRPAEFARQVRQEAAKVTWPTRKEAMMASGVVVVMVFFSSLFFLMIDFAISSVIKLVLRS